MFQGRKNKRFDKNGNIQNLVPKRKNAAVVGLFVCKFYLAKACIFDQNEMQHLYINEIYA